MWTVVQVIRTGQIIWISEQGTYNNKLCKFLGHSKQKGVMPN